MLVESISIFDFDITPIRGKSNKVADGLSKKKVTTTEQNEYDKELFSKFMRKKASLVLSTLEPGSKLIKTLINEYQSNPLFNELLRHPKELFEVRNGLIFRGTRLSILDMPIRINLLHDYHSTPCAGHLSEAKTQNRIIPLYYWRIMKKTVEDYVKSCHTCQ